MGPRTTQDQFLTTLHFSVIPEHILLTRDYEAITNHFLSKSCQFTCVSQQPLSQQLSLFYYFSHSFVCWGRKESGWISSWCLSILHSLNNIHNNHWVKYLSYCQCLFLIYLFFTVLVHFYIFLLLIIENNKLNSAKWKIQGIQQIITPAKYEYLAPACLRNIQIGLLCICYKSAPWSWGSLFLLPSYLCIYVIS